MLLFAYAFGIPGFITDPLFDTSKNAVIHAHCVAPTRMDGPGTRARPFIIRTHRDDNRGRVAGGRHARRPADHLREVVNLTTAMLVSAPARSSRKPPSSTTAAAARRSPPR